MTLTPVVPVSTSGHAPRPPRNCCVSPRTLHAAVPAGCLNPEGPSPRPPRRARRPGRLTASRRSSLYSSRALQSARSQPPELWTCPAVMPSTTAGNKPNDPSATKLSACLVWSLMKSVSHTRMGPGIHSTRCLFYLDRIV